MTITTRLAGLAFVASLAVAAPVLAQSVLDEGVRSRTVSYADLDLSRDAGMHTAARRIHAAAQDVCGPNPAPTPLSERATYNTCMHAAVTAAMASVNASVALAKADQAAKPVELAVATPLR